MIEYLWIRAQVKPANLMIPKRKSDSLDTYLESKAAIGEEDFNTDSATESRIRFGGEIKGHSSEHGQMATDSYSLMLMTGSSRNYIYYIIYIMAGSPEISLRRSPWDPSDKLLRRNKLC